MKNGQLKPGYNVHIGTEGQFIVGYSIHQKPTDTTCLIPHLEGLNSALGRLPQNIVADSGYGSEENYEYLQNKELGNYVKYNNFQIEHTRKFKKDRFCVENLPYDEHTDTFTCLVGKRLTYLKTTKRVTENGYITERRIYQAENCLDCPFKSQCTKSVHNRHIQVSFKLNAFKKKAWDNLHTEQGQKLRSLRGVEVESVFGRLKSNWSFRRFMLRGIEKVKIEWGLLSIAHNLTKVTTVVIS